MNITNAEQNYNLSTRSSHLDKRSSSLSRCLYRAQPRCHQSDILWLRLANLSTGPQKLACLEKALQANPYNKQTLRLIERLDPQRAERARMMINCLIEIIESV